MFFYAHTLEDANDVSSTGATGYIGGDALYGLYNKHPEFSYVALVRTPEKAKAVTDKFPKVRTVIGDNDSTDLLKEESSKADIVIRMPSPFISISF